MFKNIISFLNVLKSTLVGTVKTDLQLNIASML